MQPLKLSQYLLVILFGMFISVSAQEPTATKEQAVKAGFIYNFTKFTVWPSNADVNDKFNLCVIGDDKLGRSLKALRGKLANNRPLVIRRNLKEVDLHICHVAFVAGGQPEKILQKLHSLPVLTVSDSPDFIEHGGMIGLVRNGSYVGFEVNLIAVKAAKLNISAQLLKLAKKVKGLK